MVIFLIILIVSIAISLYVILPLIKGYIKLESSMYDINQIDNVNYNEYIDQIKKRDLILDEIRDIDFDFGLGKLNSYDYNEIKDKYRYKAAEIFKQIDEIEEFKIDTDESDSIEKEILQVKKSILNIH